MKTDAYVKLFGNALETLAPMSCNIKHLNQIIKI